MAAPELSALLIESLDGQVQLELFSRALPYRPLTIGGRQRAQFTWYPGSPAAIVQMLGPEEQPIQMEGFWKDRFIGVGNGTDGIAKANRVPVYSVTALVEFVDVMRRTGRQYKLTWDKLVRYGHITEFVQTWHTVHDCEWSLEFTVSAQEGQTTVVVPRQGVDTTSFAQTMNQLAQDIATTLDVDPPFGVLDAFRAQEAALSAIVTSTINNTSALVTRTVTQIISPLSGARELSSSAAQAVASTGIAMGTIQDTALSEFAAFPGGQNLAPIGTQVSAYSYMTEWRNSARALRNYSAEARYSAERQAQQDLVASFTAQALMDYRDVSMRYYGTQESWRDLMLFNHDTTSAIFPGQLIWVPLRTDRPAGYGTAGTAGVVQR